MEIHFTVDPCILGKILHAKLSETYCGFYSSDTFKIV